LTLLEDKEVSGGSFEVRFVGE
jgi:hypothetical protein